MPEHASDAGARDDVAPVAHPSARPEPVDPDVPGVFADARADAGPRPGLVRSRWDVLVVIAAGGALGSLARWGVGELLPWSGGSWPWATFVENIAGGFLLGALMVFLLDVWPPHRYLRPFMGVGLLGGSTTFSTWMLEARDLLAVGEAPTAFGYLAGSLVTGLAAVWAGIALARFVARTAPDRVHLQRDPTTRTTPPTTGRRQHRRSDR